AGKPVVRFETVLAHLSRVDDDAPIAGRTVERVHSVGKHLLIEFSDDLVLRTHMRMAGSWHVYRPGERWQRPRSAMRGGVETADFRVVAFDGPVAEFRTVRELARDPAVASLGPDVLDPGFDEGGAPVARAGVSRRGGRARGPARTRRPRERVQERGVLRRARAPVQPGGGARRRDIAPTGPDGAPLPGHERARVERRWNGDLPRAATDHATRRPVGPAL